VEGICVSQGRGRGVVKVEIGADSLHIKNEKKKERVGTLAHRRGESGHHSTRRVNPSKGRKIRERKGAFGSKVPCEITLKNTGTNETFR